VEGEGGSALLIVLPVIVPSFDTIQKLSPMQSTTEFISKLSEEFMESIVSLEHQTRGRKNH